MADNFLEGHYEEYLKRKAEWERKKKLGIIKKKSVSPKGKTDNYIFYSPKK